MSKFIAFKSYKAVIIVSNFVEMMWHMRIIKQETMEDFDNCLHDCVSICSYCEELLEDCECDPEPRYNREYDDEASLED